MGKDADDYLRLANKEGVGVLNERELAVENSIEWLDNNVDELLVAIERKIEDMYPDKPEDLKSEMIAWIQTSIPRESPDLYLEGTLEQEFDDELAEILIFVKYPRLFVEDEENQQYWSTAWKVIRTLRREISNLQEQLGAIQKARTMHLLLDKEKSGKSIEALPSEVEQPASEELPSDFFKNKPTLLTHGEKIVDKYRSDPSGLPDKMGRFHSWVGPDGETAVKQLQGRMRETGCINEYTHGDPESFCELVEGLVKRHYGN